jgi:predicted Rossmann-fold nucleotide-binding protein
VSEDLALAYLEKGGSKVIGTVPEGGPSSGAHHLNPGICDETISIHCMIEQAPTLDKHSDVLLAFGLSPGTMIELCYSRWFKVRRVYIIEGLMTTRLPEELERKLDLEYVHIDRLGEHL